MSDTITRLLFMDGSLLKYVGAEEFFARMDDRKYEAAREEALSEMAEENYQGKQQTDNEIIKLFARKVGLPEAIMSGKIEYEVDAELAEFLRENEGRFSVAVLTAKPKKARAALEKSGIRPHDVFSPQTVRIDAMSAYLADNGLLIDDRDSQELMGFGNKYSIRYSGIEDFKKFLEAPVVDSAFHTSGGTVMTGNNSSALMDTIRHTPWTPGRVVMEVLITAVLGLVIVNWLWPKFTEPFWQWLNGMM